MNNPQISICIPCYNVESYLPTIFKCLEDQIFTNFEVVFVDDGSTDNTLKVLQDYKKSNVLNKPITIVTQKNIGLSSTRNVLAKHAKGDYIFFLDADDQIPKNSLQVLYDNSENGTKDIVVGRSNVVFGRKYRFPFLVQYRYVKKITSGHFVKSNICLAWGCILRRSIFDDHEFLNKYSYEDIGLMNYIFLKYTNFKAIKDIVYYYQRHRDSLSSFCPSRKWKIIDIYHQVNHAFTKYNIEGWIQNKEYRRYINGTLFQFTIATNWLQKYYSNNRHLNNMPLYAIVKMLDDFKMTLSFSKTFWKSLSYLYIIKKFRKNVKVIKGKKNSFLKNVKFIDGINDSIKNSSKNICIIDSYKGNEEFIRKHSKTSFFSLDSTLELPNVLNGIKPKKIDNSILEPQEIFFIDLREFTNLTDKEIDIINKINYRIIVLVDESVRAKLNNTINIIGIKK